MEYETIGVKVPEDKKKAVRVAAAKRNMDMSAWMREAIDEKLAKEKSEGNPIPTAIPAD